MMVAALCFAVSASPAPPAAVSPTADRVLADTQVSLSARNGRGHVVLKSATTGWVLIGFNDRRGLNRAWLIMAKVNAAGDVVVEEHRAAPPRHAPISSRSMTPHVRDISGDETKGVTTVRFSVPLRRSAGAPFDLVGAQRELIVAHSESDDFDHHSRAREHRWGQLHWPKPGSVAIPP